MIRKTQFILIGIILALIVVTLGGLLVRQVMADGMEEVEQADNSSIFESVSNLEALNLGLIDGEQLREENGISSN